LNHPGSPLLSETDGTRATGVDISVRSGSGSGRTRLSAFDHALLNAGVGNFNLVLLSSVIPPRSVLTRVPDGAAEPVPGGHGDRLYCVLSTAYALEPGQQVWAGIGWVVDDNGQGLFVEHSAATEADLRQVIADSLGDLAAHRGGGYGEIQTEMTSATCVDRPACALSVAAFEVAGWTPRG
jgi:arginine decarboxylase